LTSFTPATLLEDAASSVELSAADPSLCRPRDDAALGVITSFNRLQYVDFENLNREKRKVILISFSIFQILVSLLRTSLCLCEKVLKIISSLIKAS
jgi:hypothetical protein